MSRPTMLHVKSGGRGIIALRKLCE
jgi:hypothetical protein